MSLNQSVTHFSVLKKEEKHTKFLFYKKVYFYTAILDSIYYCCVQKSYQFQEATSNKRMRV